MDFSLIGLQNIIDIAFYNYDRPEGFLRFQYRKKEKQSNAKWVARTKRLHLTDDIKEIMRLEDEKAKEKEKDKEEVCKDISQLQRFATIKLAIV